ncbi:hypothetical protein, partial [Marinobacter sp.]|uniref:hypothetical protein n=1 Tax=Marinobacter sp. TaxID=50741 RepID=UPI003A956A0E
INPRASVGEIFSPNAHSQTSREDLTMAVKHTPTNVIHKGNKGGKTGCGFDTRENAHHWVSSSQRITCDKNGCKN